MTADAEADIFSGVEAKKPGNGVIQFQIKSVTRTSTTIPGSFILEMVLTGSAGLVAATVIGGVRLPELSLARGVDKFRGE